MTPEVEKAISEIEARFSAHKITVEKVADGGAQVVVDDLHIGDQYEPNTTWIGFVIGFQYPHADVYPHYVNPDLKRKDSQSFGQGFSPDSVDWAGRKARQISRKSNRLNPLTDTAALKLAKVIEWLKSQ